MKLELKNLNAFRNLTLTSPPCFVFIENGSAGIEYIREFDIALITSGYAKSRGVQAVTGQVLMYDFSEKGGRYETKKLKIQGVTLDRVLFYLNATLHVLKAHTFFA